MKIIGISVPLIWFDVTLHSHILCLWCWSFHSNYSHWIPHKNFVTCICIHLASDGHCYAKIVAVLSWFAWPPAINFWGWPFYSYVVNNDNSFIANIIPLIFAGRLISCTSIKMYPWGGLVLQSTSVKM